MNKKEKLNRAAVDDHSTIPVVAEQLLIAKEVVETGSIRISKDVEEKQVDIPLVTVVHGYTVERRTVDEYVDEPPPAMRYDGKTMVISVVEEELVIVKRLKLKEEIRVTPYEQENVRTEKVNLKKERISIEKDPPKNDYTKS